MTAVPFDKALTTHFEFTEATFPFEEEITTRSLEVTGVRVNFRVKDFPTFNVSDFLFSVSFFVFTTFFCTVRRNDAEAPLFMVSLMVVFPVLRARIRPVLLSTVATLGFEEVQADTLSPEVFERIVIAVVCHPTCRVAEEAFKVTLALFLAMDFFWVDPHKEHLRDFVPFEKMVASFVTLQLPYLWESFAIV
jgi:hypothetical protein